MIFPLPSTRRVVALALGLALVIADHAWAQTQTLDRDGVAVLYPDGWRPLADQLHPWLVKHTAGLGQGHPEDLVLLMHRQRDKVLGSLCEALGLSEPTASMRTFLAQMIRLMAKALGSMPDPRQVRLWPEADLVAHLDRGGKLPGYTYNRRTGRVSFGISLMSGDRRHIEPPGPVPVVLGAGTERARLAQAQEKLVRVLTGVRAMGPCLAATALTATARLGIRRGLGLSAPGDTWLVEGSAHHAAWTALKRHFPSDVAEGFLASLDTRAYRDMRSRVHLASWAPPESGEGRRSEEEENVRKAREAFAFHEVRALAERCGHDAIARVLAELAKASKARAPGQNAVPDAIRSATGCDILPRLRVYGGR